MVDSSGSGETDRSELDGIYRDQYENSPDMHCSVDAGTALILHCNQTLITATGYSRNEIVGRPIFEMYHPDSLAGAKRAFELFVTRGEVQDVELQLKRKDGSKIDVGLSVTAVRDENGTVLRSRSVWRDITDRKRTEGRLRLTKFGLDNSSTPIFWIQEDGRICYANRAACEALGYTNEELMAMTVPDIDPDFPEGAWPEHWQKMKAAGSLCFEAHHCRSDGHVYPVEVVTSYLEHEGEEYIWAYATDISERRKAEKEKSDLEAQLLHAQKMEAVGQLAGGVAHDFNNLLTVILGNAELLSTHLEHEFTEESRDLAQQVAEQITYAGQRAASLTRQLLSFSRRDVMQAEVLDLGVVAKDAAEILQRLLREDIDFNLRVDSGCQSVFADAAQIEQVIMNLVLNARDAMPEGGRIDLCCGHIELQTDHPAVRIGANPGPHAVITVVDSGTGMSRATMDHIFEPFFTTKAVGSGTGLGLATVYGVLEQSHGHILVDSEVGKGSRFDVYLPIVKQDVLEQLDTGVKNGVPAGEVILVCEDEDLVRAVVSRSLNSAGYEVLETGSPTEALALAEGMGGRIDLLVTDVIMPKMNGKQLAGALLERFPNMRVLFISGYTSDLIEQDLLMMSEVTFLQKPFSPVVLLNLVRTIFERTGSQKT